MLSNVLTIGIGGFLGAVARYFVFMLDDKFYHKTAFPMGTLIVNLTGSLLIGIALGLSVKTGLFSRHTTLHYLFVTGFLGSFTTFSTFSQDSMLLLMDKNYLYFLLNIALNVILGIALAFGGYFLIVRQATS